MTSISKTISDLRTERKRIENSLSMQLYITKDIDPEIYDSLVERYVTTVDNILFQLEQQLQYIGEHKEELQDRHAREKFISMMEG